MAIIPLSDNASRFLADAIERHRLSNEEIRSALRLARGMSSHDSVLLFHMRLGVERVLKQREESYESQRQG